MAQLLKCASLSLVLFFTCFGCDTDEPGDVPQGEFSVDLQGNFQNDYVEVMVDGETVFSGRVTTSAVLGLAKALPVALPEGEHHVRVEVLAAPDATVGNTVHFDRHEVGTVAVRYAPEGGEISFQLLEERPLYY